MFRLKVALRLPLTEMNFAFMAWLEITDMISFPNMSLNMVDIINNDLPLYNYSPLGYRVSQELEAPEFLQFLSIQVNEIFSRQFNAYTRQFNAYNHEKFSSRFSEDDPEENETQEVVFYTKCCMVHDKHSALA